MIFVQFLSRRGKNLFEAACGDSNENDVLQGQEGCLCSGDAS